MDQESGLEHLFALIVFVTTATWSAYRCTVWFFACLLLKLISGSLLPHLLIVHLLLAAA